MIVVMMGQRSPPAPIGYVGRGAKTVVMIMVIYLQEMDEYLCTQKGRRTARSVSTGGRGRGVCSLEYLPPPDPRGKNTFLIHRGMAVSRVKGKRPTCTAGRGDRPACASGHGARAAGRSANLCMSNTYLIRRPLALACESNLIGACECGGVSLTTCRGRSGSKKLCSPLR